MKTALTLFSFIPCILFSQYSITGSVKSEDGKALAGATIQIVDTYIAAVSDAEGKFRLSNISPGDYELEVRFLSYASQKKGVTLSGEDSKVDFILSPSFINAQEVIVKANRASRMEPIAYTQIEKSTLERKNLGMDVPEILNTVPSLYFTSDAGNGIGYTYLRLRGNDQTNINVTINGVPLNDSESQGVFWVNMPDLIASTDNIQIQRGVGSSTNGAGAFGGSINFLTSGLTTEPHAEVDLGVGSFNTSKFSVGFGTGLLSEHWSLDGRISSINSDGYLDRSSASLRSYFLNGGYQDKRTSVRLMIFGGDELTQQAWWGVPRARLENDEEGMLAFAADNGWSEANTQNLLNSDRRFNFYTYDQEVDDYGQDHFQLHMTRKVNSEITFTGALHYTKGAGFFEQFQDSENAFDDTFFSDYGLSDPIIGGDTITQADFIRRRWLDNDFYGFVGSVNYTKGRWNTILGGAWNNYVGRHFGEITWASIAGNSFIRDRYYDNEAEKSDANVFLKSNYSFSEKWSAYADLQVRSIDYTFSGLLNTGETADRTVNYSFFNPKFGLTYNPSDRHRFFASYAVASKEPNRDDHVISTPDAQPEAQRLFDTEIGYAYSSQRYAAELVLYNMEYRDQLINTGQINNVGENIRTNVEESYRRGVELIISARPVDRIRIDFNATLSQNMIRNHREFVPDYLDYSLVEEEFGDVSISYSPSTILSNTITYDIYDPADSEKRIALSMISKYVGEQYLDNTETEGRTIDSFFTNDIALDIEWKALGTKRIMFNFLVRNVLDEVYESNGWTYRYLYGGQETSFDALFPQAGTNFMAGLKVEF